MSTPAASEANQQVAVVAGALEWSYTQAADTGSNKSFKSVSTKADNDLAKQTADTLICRVYRRPSNEVYTHLVEDAGAIWTAVVIRRPRKADSATNPPLGTKWPAATKLAEDGSNVNITDPHRLGELYFTNPRRATNAPNSDDTPTGAITLDTNNAKQAHCWTFEEAVEAAARLASSFENSTQYD